MEITFNDILNRMKQAFFNECGHNVDNIGDVSARFNAVASEIYSLFCNMDFVRRQSYLQTAQGEYLDYHAQLRDMHRNSASKAFGELTFGISEPINVDINIPAGTICSVKGKPYIQFKTDRAVTLRAGNTTVNAAATALECGEEYNALAYTITAMVNPPARIESVTNAEAFFGGHNVESDEALRKRLLDSFKFLPTGIGLEYTEDAIREIDGIIDCKITNVNLGSGERAKVYVRTNTGAVSSKMRAEIESKMAVVRLLGIGFDIVIAQAIMVDIGIQTKADRENVEGLAREYFGGLKIGESADLVDFRIWLSKRISEDVNSVYSAQSSGEYIVCPANQYIAINSIGVVNGD